MNDMIVKNVDVLGDSIMAAKDSDENVYAGVSYFCNALGMSRGQKNRQVINVQKDETLKRGCIKLGAGVLDEGNETIALRIDFIPLWLAKISITDKTKRENPELADKLLEYQLKAKDILTEAFMPKQSMPQTTDGKIALLAQGHTELKAEVDEIKVDLQALKLDLPLMPVEADEISNRIKKRGVEILGGKSSSAYNDRSIRQKLYNNYYFYLKQNFNVGSYKAIKRNRRNQALEIIEEYKPPLFLKEMIEESNTAKKGVSND